MKELNMNPKFYNAKLIRNKISSAKNELIDVARHPDNIYYLELDTSIEIPEYSMMKIIKRKKDSNE